MGMLRAWISVIEATGGMKIPGFNPSVREFVLVSPPPERKAVFNKRLTEDSNISTVLFHGTGLHVPRSVIRNGFTASSDTTWGSGTFMAEEPEVSYNYLRPAPTVPLTRILVSCSAVRPPGRGDMLMTVSTNLQFMSSPNLTPS